MGKLSFLLSTENFFSTVGVVLVLGTSLVTGTVVAKSATKDHLVESIDASGTDNSLADSKGVLSLTDKVQENEENSPGVTGVIPLPTPTSKQTPSNTSTDTLLPSPSSGGAMTLVELSQHNGQNGTCYIAFNGTIYDVSNHPSWKNCRHHGATGGTDITSIFPHPTSYLNGLPVIDSLDSASQPTAVDFSQSSGAGGNDDNDKEDEREKKEGEKSKEKKKKLTEWERELEKKLNEIKKEFEKEDD